MLQTQLLTIYQHQFDTSNWIHWTIAAVVVFVIIFLLYKFGNFCEDSGIEKATGKLYVLDENDIGKIFIVGELILAINQHDTKGADNRNIGIAYMREEYSLPKWYKLPYNYLGKPTRPMPNSRIRLSKGEKAEYLHFETLVNI